MGVHRRSWGSDEKEELRRAWRAFLRKKEPCLTDLWGLWRFIMRTLSAKQMEKLKHHLESLTEHNLRDMTCPICRRKGFRRFGSPLDTVKDVYFSDYRLLKSKESRSSCVVVVIPCSACGFMLQFDANSIFKAEELFE